MTDEQVRHFVDGCELADLPCAVPKANVSLDYPAYEVYTDVLRKGIYDEPGQQLRLVVGEDRRVRTVHKL